MNSMNDLLAKFDAVEVKSVNLISEGDKLFCEKNQAAYEDAVTSYRELTGFWESMEKAQRDILGEPDREQNPIYFRYLSKESGAYIDADAVRKHIEKVHSDYLDRIAEYFRDSYRIDLNIGKIRRALLPKNPDYGAEEEDIAAYREKMEDLMLRYQDILDLIFQQTDGRSFPEQSMYELKSGCHKAAWDDVKHEPRYELKKDTIRFLSDFSRYIYRHRGWQDSDWQLKDKMKAVVVPQSFLADDFTDKRMIRDLETRFSFLGQIGLPDDEFAQLGVSKFPTKLQFWQKKSDAPGWSTRRYTTELLYALPDDYEVEEEARALYEKVLALPKADLEKNKSYVLLELARTRATSKDFAYQTQKLLYRWFSR